MAKIRIGIVGCGSIGSGKHAGTLGTNYKERAELTAFCDIIPERAEKLVQNMALQAPKSTSIIKT
jgi:predicted dehydrogenase